MIQPKRKRETRNKSFLLIKAEISGAHRIVGSLHTLRDSINLSLDYHHVCRASCGAGSGVRRGLRLGGVLCPEHLQRQVGERSGPCGPRGAKGRCARVCACSSPFPLYFSLSFSVYFHGPSENQLLNYSAVVLCMGQSKLGRFGEATRPAAPWPAHFSLPLLPPLSLRRARRGPAFDNSQRHTSIITHSAQRSERSIGALKSRAKNPTKNCYSLYSYCNIYKKKIAVYFCCFPVPSNRRAGRAQALSFLLSSKGRDRSHACTGPPTCVRKLQGSIRSKGARCEQIDAVIIVPVARRSDLSTTSDRHTRP